MREKVQQLLLFCLAIGLMGCTAGTQRESVTPLAAPLSICMKQSLLEKLDLNLKKLVRVSKDMRHISEGHLFYGSDEQLEIIRKSSLYLLLSIRTTQHHNELVSLLGFVRSDRQKEVAVLLVKSLEGAVFDLAYDLNFLNTYYALIGNQTARENIDESVKIIRDNMDIYKKLIAILNECSGSGEKAAMK